MIASVSYLLLYLCLGMLSVRFLLPRHKPLNRIWLGLSFGVLEMMWLPALCAFFLGFTAAGHALAAGLLMLLLPPLAWRFLLVALVGALAAGLGVWWGGLTPGEKNFVRSKLVRK